MKRLNVIKKLALNFIANNFGIPQTAIAFLKPLSIVGRQTKIGIPKDLISLNIQNLVRGVFNRVVFASYSYWVWPYWVVRQYDSKGLTFIPTGFQIPSINVGYRNWTGLGNLNHEKECIIDTRGLLTPNIDSWSIDFFAVHNNKLYAPSQLPQVKQRVLHSIPMIETTYEVGNFVVLITTFTQTIYGRDTIFYHTNITNHGDQGDSVSVHFCIRPYNPEGISLIHKISYQNEEFYINGDMGAILMEKPNQVLCSNLKLGDISLHLIKNSLEPQNEVKCEAGLATACASYTMYLNPGEFKELEFRIPMDKTIVIKKNLYREGTYESLKRDMIHAWKDKMSEAVSVTLPDKKLEKAFKTNVSYMMLFYDGKSITPGPFNYHHFWFRDASYLLQALLKMGFVEETKEVLLTYPSRQKINGFFHSQQSEWDSNGQAIWIIAEYYRVTKDRTSLRKLISCVYIGALWIVNKLKTTEKNEVPYKGIMPLGLSAEHFGANDSYYWDDYWSLRGLLDAKFLLEELPEESFNISKIDEAIQNLKQNLEASLNWANEKFDKPYLPISPSRYMDSAAIGSVATIYPLKIFSPNDERVLNTMEFLENHCFTNGVFFHDIYHSGHGTYLNMHIAQLYLARKDPKALRIIHWMRDIATNTFTWPESIHPFTYGGVIGDGHHGWAAADFLMVIRNMLFREENDLLIFTPVIPREWLSVFEILEIKNAPSYFGTVKFSYEVTKHNELEIHIHNQYTKTPTAIEINLPVNILKIDIDDHFQEINDNKFLISPSTNFLRVFFES